MRPIIWTADTNSLTPVACLGAVYATAPAWSWIKKREKKLLGQRGDAKSRFSVWWLDDAVAPHMHLLWKTKYSQAALEMLEYYRPAYQMPVSTKKAPLYLPDPKPQRGGSETVHLKQLPNPTWVIYVHSSRRWRAPFITQLTRGCCPAGFPSKPTWHAATAAK